VLLSFYITKVPAITVVKQSTTTGDSLSCNEGDSIVLLADATTTVNAITAAGFTFTWDTTDTNHGTVMTSTTTTSTAANNVKNVFSYACTVAGEHQITVAATANHHDYAVNSEPQASFTITVNNGLPKNPSALFTSTDLTASNQAQPLQVYVGDVVQLTFTFTDASLNNVHTFKLDWGDITAIVTQTNAGKPDQRTFTAQHVYLPSAAVDIQEPYNVKTTVTDNVDVTSSAGATTKVKLTRKVTHNAHMIC
jgi:hypothetical protein